MVVDKEPASEDWWHSPRAKRLFFTLLAVLGLAAVILLVFPIFRSPAPPTDGRVFSEAPPEQLPLSQEGQAINEGNTVEHPATVDHSATVGQPATGGANDEPLNPIDQLLNSEQAPESPPTPPPSSPLESVTKLPVKAFWVQLGAYSSRAKAQESAKLVKKEFDTGESLKIEEVTISKQKFYRLRLGPYPSKEESQRIMELVRGVETFRESYILNE